MNKVGCCCAELLPGVSNNGMGKHLNIIGAGYRIDDLVEMGLVLKNKPRI